MGEIIQQTNFGALDWAIVGAYLAGSVAVGLYVRKYVSNMADYVVAGRGVRTALGVATMTGTPRCSRWTWSRSVCPSAPGSSTSVMTASAGSRASAALASSALATVVAR